MASRGQRRCKVSEAPLSAVKDGCPQDLSMLKIAEKNFKEKHPPFRTSEDCLYLNIYSPAGSNKKDKLPVMVWIHGGNFIFGGASRYDGSALSAYENIVVVIIQYRLGLLGFLNTGDEHARGNWAFLDQVAALQWIQENIEHFGGDPGSVTLFGVSAGSCSVFAHVLSPLSKGLFHKAISESGILIPPDKDLLLSTDLKTSKIPGLKEIGDKKSITSTLEFLLPMMDVPSEFLPVIVDEYLGNTDDPAELRDRFLDLLGDVGIVMPSIKALNYHRESGAPAYFFEYQHRPTSYWDSKPEYVKADHGDEVGFVFGGPYLAGDIQLRSEVTEEEKNLSRTLMKYWANFARNGNPNGEGLVDWPSYNLSEEYLQINLKQKKARKLKEKKVDFWRKVMFEKTNNKRMENKKVFVWIHGGGLVFGAASSYDGSALAAFDNVVVVTIQYRLGIVGYFSTGDKHARGNWGYLDQVAALQWVQENIIHFGGDPGSVTIAGESAGGISVSALVLSPLAKGLFHKAISESGTAVRVLFTDQPEEEAQRIATASGCEKFSSAAIVECLREKTEEEILQITLKMPSLFISASADGVFFPKSPRQLLSEKMINEVPYIIGVNNCEFGWVLPMTMKFPAYADGLDEDVARRVLQSSLALSLKGVTSEVVDQVYNEYIGKAENSAQVRDGLLDAIGDPLFVLSAIEVARYHRDAGNPVYFYEFQHRPSSATGVVPEFVKADHTDEIAFVFGKPFLAGYATEEENKLSRTVMRYWTNFARNGNPNGEGLVHWPQYDLDERYLEIDLTQKAAKKLKERKMEFWTQLTQQMMNERREHTDL
ncbi:hypothetical protein QYF61_018151 [Mycteria americana]|uniref:Carboxylesterase type B domain-containing protein n=1 Tax=Mycteria americana TaxID=33587 RepID=A0AAN7MVL2_MYCAM|nr:hypothetical protein QYF61_018151 [Mycteria americana]